MLKPYPESDLSINILVLGSEIIGILNKKNDFIITENVMNVFLERDLKRTPDMFMDVMSLLFALGLIELNGYKIRLNKNDFTEQDLFGNWIV